MLGDTVGDSAGGSEVTAWDGETAGSLGKAQGGCVKDTGLKAVGTGSLEGLTLKSTGPPAPWAEGDRGRGAAAAGRRSSKGPGEGMGLGKAGFWGGGPWAGVHPRQRAGDGGVPEQLQTPGPTCPLARAGSAVDSAAVSVNWQLHGSENSRVTLQTLTLISTAPVPEWGGSQRTERQCQVFGSSENV